VIGGSGFYTVFGSDARSVIVDTPYGGPSAPVTVGRVGCHEVAFLPRHGLGHEYSPHTVPYRANMWALRALGVRRVFGPCAVGSLSAPHTISEHRPVGTRRTLRGDAVRSRDQAVTRPAVRTNRSCSRDRRSRPNRSALQEPSVDINDE
jgi:purine nucleoside phosphorylase